MGIRSMVAAAALIAGAVSATSALAETLKVSSFLPPKHTFNRMLEAWSAELSEKSGGELSLEVFPAGQLGPPPRQFDLVRSGAADMAIILHGATPGRFKTTELAGLPLTYPSAGDDSAVTSRRLTELAPEYLAAEHAGTRIMWMAVTPPLKVHLRDDAEPAADALMGKRVRYAGAIWQQIIEELGGSPVPVPPAESADALGKGVVDGASFPFEAAKAFDLAPVTKASLTPGLASATFAVVLSDAAYNRLSPELQKLIDETTGPDRGEAFGKMWDAGEAEGLAYMEEAGINIVTLPEDQLSAVRERIAPIVQGAVGAVDNGQAFLDAYTK